MSAAGLSENNVAEMIALSHALPKLEQGTTGLRTWVRQNPPGQADYTADTPERAVYLYQDDLVAVAPGLRVDTIYDLIDFSRFTLAKTVKKTLQSIRGAAKGNERERVTARHPGYTELLGEIKEAKREWNKDDARIKTTHEFRMMGGLTRMGTQAASRYRYLVERAQRMEKDVLGKVLTPHGKVS